MLSFKNSFVYVENKGIVKTDLSFNEKIVSTNKVLGDIICLPENCTVFPGFIDRHTHGIGGFDTMDGTFDAINNISNSMVKNGVTAFLPTTMTCSLEQIERSLISLRKFVEEDTLTGAEVIGVHLEGPFISSKFKGAQLEECILPPNIDVFNKLNDISNGLIKIVTLAPEVDGAFEFIKYLKEKGVVASVGHSSATAEQVFKAIELGVSSSTHTYNAQSPIHHRDIGVVGASLISDIYTEIIVDNIHLSVPAIKLLLKCKSKDKVILISDSMRACGIKEGESELGGQKVIIKNGEARLIDGTLAGSVLKLNVAVKNAVNLLGLSVEDAIDMASKNPAQSLNIYDKKGSIREGKDADFTVLDKDFNVYMTIRSGKIVYKA